MKGPDAPHPGEGIQTRLKATERSRSGFAAFDTLRPRAGATKGSVPRATPHKLTPGSHVEQISHLVSAPWVVAAARSWTQLPKQPGTLKAPGLTVCQHFPHTRLGTAEQRLPLSSGITAGVPGGRSSCCPKS